MPVPLLDSRGFHEKAWSVKRYTEFFVRFTDTFLCRPTGGTTILQPPFPGGSFSLHRYRRSPTSGRRHQPPCSFSQESFFFLLSQLLLPDQREAPHIRPFPVGPVIARFVPLRFALLPFAL